MASSSLVLKDHSGVDVTFTLVSQGIDFAEFRDIARPLSQPLSLKFKYKLGNPGSLGNDKVTVEVMNVLKNSTTGNIVTGRAVMDISIPRDAVTWVSGQTETLMAYIANLLTSARRENLADAMTP